MTNLIKNWQLKKASSKKAHRQFVKQLKRKKSKALDELGNALHEEVFKEINCLDCANCCSTIPPLVNRTDVNRISKHLGMKPSDFQKQYVVEDEDGDQVMNTSPCPFLQTDHTCEIYEHRPKACRKYPHTDQFEFSQHLTLHGVNSMHCPAVFYILERMMKRIND